jgi:hypothetical protein
MGHRPMFSGQPAGGDGTQDGRQLENLLIDNQVDVTVAGHVHYAQRSCPWRHGVCVTPNVTGGYDGPVHIVAGNGGQSLNNATSVSRLFPYTGSGCIWGSPNCSHTTRGLKRGSGSEFGISAFTANATDFTWSFLGDNDSDVHHTFTIHRAFPRIKSDDSGCGTVPLSCAPDGCATAIVRTASACSAAGGGTVHLLSGIYPLHAASTTKADRALVVLSGLQNVSIVGQAGLLGYGSRVADPTATTVLVHGLHGAFHVSNCSGVTMSNIQVDLFRPPITYGRVIEVNDENSTLLVNNSEYPFPASEMKWLSKVQGILGFDPETWRVADNGLDIGGEYTCTSTGLDQVTITGAGSQMGLRTNSFYILRHQIYAFNGFTFTNVSSVRLTNVQIWSAAGMGFLFDQSRDITLQNCGVRRRPGKPMSTNADASHFAECSGFIHIDGVHFSGQGDDGINIHGFFHSVTQLKDTPASFAIGNRPVGGTAPLHVGEMYEFRNRRSWKVEGIGRMLSATNAAGSNGVVQTATFAFKEPHMSENVAEYALLSDLDRTPSYVLIENSVFASSRARGALIKASNVTGE